MAEDLYVVVHENLQTGEVDKSTQGFSEEMAQSFVDDLNDDERFPESKFYIEKMETENEIQ